MIIGTAGHIDHGKSALVTAITGRPVDRLEEEQRRGITIDLNFAPLEFPGLPPAGIIDVPGHEDLVRTMVAGASGIDLVLLVIDLTEGIRPQTEEHLVILEQLGIPAGIPVFTKSDLADPDWTALVVAETAERLARSTVRFEEPAIVSALTGAGIDLLRGRLEQRVRLAAARSTRDRFRMPVDRVFSVAGVGTVVTGTTWSGRVAPGDAVRVLPGGAEARIRSVEAYGRPTDAARPAVRTAVGMSGVDRDQVQRGDQIVTGQWVDCLVLDVVAELIAGAAHPLVPRTRVRVHLGTAEVLARLIGRHRLDPGERGPLRLRLETPLIARGGDRLVLRSYSPVATIGGGRIVDLDPPVSSAWDPGLEAAEAAPRAGALTARRRFGVGVDLLPQLLGQDEAGTAAAATKAGLKRVGSRWVAPSVLAELGQAAEAAVRDHHQRAPAEPGLSAETLRQRLRAPDEIAEYIVKDADKRGAIRLKDGIASLKGFAPTGAGGDAAVARLAAYVEQAGLEAPTIDEISTGASVAPIGPALRLAVERGLIQAIDRERYASRPALDRFRQALEDIGRAGDITPAAIRDRLGLTRKFLIPLLEWADRQGITRRVGEARVLVRPPSP